MFHAFDEKKLKRLMIDFCEIFAEANLLYSIPTYEHVLQQISCFSVLPNWNTTSFLSRKSAQKIIPLYIEQRRDFFSNDDCSLNLSDDGVIKNYFNKLKVSYPKAVKFCNQLIKVILMANLGAYVESTSAESLGIAHLDFKKHYNENDFNELIIHQITHMLLFIDDYIEPQVVFSNKMLPIVTTIKNKRGGNAFPFYTLFHSFCVGVEVLQYRYLSNTLTASINYHAETLTAIKRCSNCFDVLNENSLFFTEKGRRILNEYREALYDLKTRIFKC